VFQAIGGKRLCHGRIQYYEVENQPEFPGAGERNRKSSYNPPPFLICVLYLLFIPQLIPRDDQR
jgi:hypothetical protein